MNIQNPDPFLTSALGKGLIFLGVVIIILGLILIFKDKISILKYLGHLPGDIAVEKENFRFYFPITTCILLSAFLSFIFWLFRR